MAFLKFGFHTGAGGVGVPKSFYQELNNAGIPYFAKGADAFPFDAQQIAQTSAVTHTVVFRRSQVPGGASPPPSGDPNVPRYSASPAIAAAEHWSWHKAHFPPELDKSVTWVETINEVDKNRAEWLGEFAYETAVLTLQDGYRWAAFGFSAGEPEPEHWTGPQMRRFLSLAAANSKKVAVALHEYSYSVDFILDDNYHVGRFKRLLEVNPGVTILITEWGWTLWNAPAPAKAMEHYDQAGELYAGYPQVSGAATWYLGSGYQNIYQKVQKLISPLKVLTLNTTYPDPQPPPTPGYTVVVVKAPQEATAAEWSSLASYSYQYRHTMTASDGDAIQLLTNPRARPDSFAKIFAPARPSQVKTIEQLEALGLHWQELTLGAPPPPPPQPAKVDLLPYILPDVTYGRLYEMQHSSGPTETFQLQRAGGSHYLLVKNRQWEEFYLHDDFICRGKDTSPGPAPAYATRPGALRWYWQREPGFNFARWCPRYLAVGEDWAGNGHFVQFYYKSDCEPSASNSGPATNRITLVARHANKTWNGITVNDVIQLSNGTETWYYARDVGMVAWEGEGGAGSAICEWLSGRPNLLPETGCFS